MLEFEKIFHPQLSQANILCKRKGDLQNQHSFVKPNGRKVVLGLRNPLCIYSKAISHQMRRGTHRYHVNNGHFAFWPHQRVYLRRFKLSIILHPILLTSFVTFGIPCYLKWHISILTNLKLWFTLLPLFSFFISTNTKKHHV